MKEAIKILEHQILASQIIITQIHNMLIQLATEMLK